jgi:hypothetical protein
LTKNKVTARIKGERAFSTAENQEAFIVRNLLKGVVEELVERKGFEKEDNGKRG